MKSFKVIVNKINELVGVTVSYLIILHAAVILWGVTFRYVFKSPLFWPDEMALFFFGAYVVLAGGFTLLHDGHVSVDIRNHYLSERTRAVIDCFTSPLFFLFCGTLLWKGAEIAWASVKILECSYSEWGPHIWPIKLTIPLGAFLLLIQGIVKLYQ